MTLYQIKPAFQNMLRPCVRLLNTLNISPNNVTIVTCLLSCLFSYFLAKNHQLLMYVPLFFFVRMAFNAIDGMLAKEFNKQTKLGGMLNEMTDVISDTVLYLALIPHLSSLSHSILCFTLLSFLSEYTGVTALSVGAVRRYDGPLGKSDRALFISIIALLLTFSTFSNESYFYIYAFGNTLLVLTTINRLKKALKSH